VESRFSPGGNRVLVTRRFAARIFNGDRMAMEWSLNGRGQPQVATGNPGTAGLGLSEFRRRQA
jgi:hypothetical protein